MDESPRTRAELIRRALATSRMDFIQLAARIRHLESLQARAEAREEWWADVLKEEPASPELPVVE